MSTAAGAAADPAAGHGHPGTVYRVHALRLGTITVDMAGLLHGRRPSTLIDIPVWSAAIEGGSRRILVDTGFADPRRWSAYNPCRQRPRETLPAALAELGWTVRDIDIVINTHLHYDHCENNPALERAEFFVSRAKWEFAQAPVPSQNWSYQAAWTGGAITYRNYHLLGGDYQVAPGLRIIQTPRPYRGPPIRSGGHRRRRTLRGRRRRVPDGEPDDPAGACR